MPKGTKLQRQATEFAQQAGINYTAALRIIQEITRRALSRYAAAVASDQNTLLVGPLANQVTADGGPLTQALPEDTRILRIATAEQLTTLYTETMADRLSTLRLAKPLLLIIENADQLVDMSTDNPDCDDPAAAVRAQHLLSLLAWGPQTGSYIVATMSSTPGPNSALAAMLPLFTCTIDAEQPNIGCLGQPLFRRKTTRRRKMPNAFPTDPTTSWALVDAARAGYFRIGLAQTREPVDVSLDDGHLLVIGDRLTGKTNLLNLLLFATGKLPDDYDVVVFNGAGADPSFPAEAATSQNISVVGEPTVEAELDRIRQLVTARRSKGQPHKRMLLVISDLSNLMLGCATALGSLADILVWGPAVGVHVVATNGWMPTDDLGGLLSLFNNRMLLGWARDDVDHTLFGAEVFAEDKPGRGWLKAADAAPIPVQTFWVNWVKLAS